MRVRISRLRSRATGGASLAAEASLSALGVTRPAALMLLGHMRSGSTLLLHLLLTNPEVAAVGERNVSYASAADLARLALAARWARARPLRRLRYVVDQVNHNKFTPDAQLLRGARVRLVFLLREPQSALASLLELSRTYYDDSWTVSRAVDYYVERLQGLATLAASIEHPGRAVLVRYEMLTSRPAQVLESLRRFLGLSEGFSQTYPVQAFTRQRGDPGPKIAAGAVLPSGAAAPAVDFKPGELLRVRDAYARCEAALAGFVEGA